MDFRAYSMEVRGLQEAGMFTGYASVFGNIDSYGTVVDKGAFKKTIKDNKGQFPVLFFHDPTRPVGMTSVQEDGHGLLVDGKIDLNTSDGQLVYSGLREGYIDRMSIGFDVITATPVDGIPHFKELRLWENSLITRNFAANEDALVTDVRATVAGLRRIQVAMQESANLELQNALADLRTLVEQIETRKATPFADLPLADKATKWDAGKARARVKDWADGDMAKYRRAFLWYDAENADNLTAYKFPIGDIIDGKLKAVPRGIYAAAARLDGSDIDDKDKVKRSIERYYKKMGEDAPWNRSVEIPGWADTVLDEIRKINKALSNEPPTGEEPHSHSDPLEELRAIGAQLRNTLVETR